MSLNFEEKMQSVKGVGGVFFRNLTTGEEQAFNADVPLVPASMIKLATFMAVCKMVSEGKATFEERLKIPREKWKPSCGAIKSFTFEPTIDIGTLCHLSITISDNTAANMIMEHFGIERLNKEFRAMGLVQTHLERCFFDDERQAQGYDNKATVRELGKLLTQVYEGTFVSKEVSEYVLHTLQEQTFRSKIPAYLREYVPVANKTGESGDITGDMAVILGERPFVLVILYNDTYAPETDEWIRHFAKEIFDEVNSGRL